MPGKQKKPTEPQEAERELRTREAVPVTTEPLQRVKLGQKGRSPKPRTWSVR